MTSNNSSHTRTSSLRDGQKGFATPIVIAIALVVAGIAYYAIQRQSEGAAMKAKEEAAMKVKEGSRISFQSTNLDPLEKGHYEGWIIVGEKKISFGSFNVNKQKQLVDLTGKAITEFKTKEKIERADVFAISIEPDNDTDLGPSKTLILFGKAVNNRSNLAFGVGPGQTDFNKLSGRYILGTPTDDPDKNETAGVWFVNPTNAPRLVASLNLPDAPDGWKYEGWSVHVTDAGVLHPISIGRFSKVSGADEFSGYSSTKKPAPPFPGEDFIQNLPFGLKGPLAMDNGKSLVVVSIEPDLNGADPTGDGPSQLKPLIGRIPAGAKDHFLYNLEVKNDSLPTGVASLLQ